jgi:hypothetical protein
MLINYKSCISSNTYSVMSRQCLSQFLKIHTVPSIHFTQSLWRLTDSLHVPYKQRYIAGSKKCSTKPLSILLTKILTAVKERLQMYCATVYARSGANQMWILKNSKELLESLNSPIFFSSLQNQNL